VAVRYIRTNTIANLFAPATRAFGNIAIIGEATAGPANSARTFTDPADALTTFPGTLGTSIALAFAQSPGPALIFGIRPAAGPDWAGALTECSSIDAQFVVLAGVALTAVTTPTITLLANHVTTVSGLADGKERMGVVMLAKGATATGLVTGTLAHERMIYCAHKSDQDVGAAVAGTIAGYEPHISPLLKQVNVLSDPFTPAEIVTINGAESFNNPPAGQGVNWLVDPVLIPGRGVYLGEAYTGNPGGKKFIDIVRTIDDVSFRLKARMIAAVGNLRISRSGLRSLVAQVESVLMPLQANEVIEGFTVMIPILSLLDKDPNQLTPAEVTAINNAQSTRLVQVLVAVDYAGAIHRIDLTLKFE
jgi:hypothetical protein